MTPELVRVVEDGATLLTPNRRLARDLKRAFDTAQQAVGRTAWRSADILPWSSWLERTFGEATRFGPGERLLTQAQELAAWEQVIEPSAATSGLFDPVAAAGLTRDAWMTEHAWHLALKGWTGGLPDDARHYVDWSSRYAQLCAEGGWLDAARLPAALAQRLSGGSVTRKQPLIRYGFDQPSPQDRALLAAWAAGGVEVQERQPQGERGRAVRRAFLTAEDELAAVAAAARDILLARPKARVGIVVPGLSRRRADVVRLLDDALEPGRVLGATRERARPYNLSLGQPLARYPLVHAALSVLRLARGELSLHEAGALLRSPFIGAGEQEFTRRALLDARLRRRGRLSVSLPMLQSEAQAKNHDDPHACRALSALLAAWRPLADAACRGRRLPSAWGSAFLSLLSGLGWPGERTLDSEDYQTWRRWRELVSELSLLDAVLGAVPHEQALAWLARLSADTLFQPESEDVPVQVLGVLESAGLCFDHLFVTGLHDEALPAAARPNPLLPASLQRAHRVPHASAEWELGFANRMMAWWARAAPEIVFSHPMRDGERELGASPLLASIPDAGTQGARAGRYAELIRGAARVERLVDDTAPTLHAGHEVGGGTSVFRDQAACPFRAFAIHRLGARALEEGRPGLDPRERGILLHEAVRYLWGTIGSHERLLALSSAESDDAVASAVDRALVQMRRSRPDALSDAFLVLERARLCALLPRLLAIEKQRTPFTVVQREEPYPLEIAGLRVQVRPDRIDLLDAGGSVILDYKSGKATPRSWVGDRPDEPQLPLYAIELGVEVAGVSFVTLRADRVAFEGLARVSGLLPGVEEAADWPALLESWRAMRDALAAEFLGGRAAVAPKDPRHTCRSCAVRPFCRMVELFADKLEDDQEGGNE